MANMSNYPIMKAIRNMGDNIKIDSETNLSELMTQLQTANTNIGSVASDISSIKTNVSAVKTDVATVNTNVNTVNTNVGTVKTNLATVDNIVDTINSNVSNIKTNGIQSVKSVQRGRAKPENVQTSSQTLADTTINISNVDPLKSVLVFSHSGGYGSGGVTHSIANISSDGNTIKIRAHGFNGQSTYTHYFPYFEWQVIEFY